MFKEVVTDIFFDLDHTLWDFEKNSALTFGKIFTENGIDIDLRGFLNIYVPRNLAFWKLYREGRIEREVLRYQRLKTVFDDMGYRIDDSTIYKLSDQYIEHLSSFPHLFPNAVSVLEYLSKSYRLHIITNGFQEVQDRKLRNAQIDRFFDHVINSEMAGVKKPDPGIFELAGTVPAQSLMIGDNLEADILGAQAMGFHVLHFEPNKVPQHQVCTVIADLGEIKSYL